jgi:predicted nucleic acid-binding Zn ribbon protein
MNVTDSLDALSTEIQRARNCLSPALTRMLDYRSLSPEDVGRHYGRIADTLIILDDALDLARREQVALAELGNLMRHKECVVCGDAFSFVQVPGRMPMYCSHRCRQAAYRERAARRSEGVADHTV